MRRKVIQKTIRRAHAFNLPAREQTTRGQLRFTQSRVALPPNVTRGVRVQRRRHVKRAFKLERRPIEERVTDRQGHRGGPVVKLLLVRRWTSDELFRHAG